MHQGVSVLARFYKFANKTYIMAKGAYTVLDKRIEELEYEVQSLKQLIHEIEYATTRLIDEKIEEATLGLVSLEEVEVAFDL